MSLKIYNGYRFTHDMSLRELNERMIRLRQTYMDETQKKYKMYLIDQIYAFEDLYQIDKKCCIGALKEMGSLYDIPDEKNANKIIAFNVAFNFREIVTKMMESRTLSSLNFRSEIQVFPVKDKILMQFFGIDSLESILLTQKDIKEYHYQNQCDRPDYISEDEWEQRYKDWREAMPDWCPVKNGFGVTLFSQVDLSFTKDDFIFAEDVKKYKKTIKERAKCAADAYCQAKEEIQKLPYRDFSLMVDKKAQEFSEILKDDPLEELYGMHIK